MFHRGGDKLTYGIFTACRRCTYAKSHEPILIFSMHRGPRIIVDNQKGVFVRHQECLGFDKCGRCFEAIDKDIEVPCLWAKI